MGRKAKKGLVRMTKGDVSHDFVPESVRVWAARGWAVDNDAVESAPSAEVANAPQGKHAETTQVRRAVQQAQAARKDDDTQGSGNK